MAVIRVDALEQISDAETLFLFLNQQLSWPVDPADTFTYPLVYGPENSEVQAGQIPPFTGSDPFALVLVEFSSNFKRTTLRTTLQQIRRKMKEEGKLEGRNTEDIIFICPANGYNEIRFAHFIEREGKQPKLSVFGWERRNTDTTATVRRANLDYLRMPESSTLFGADPAQWRDKWLQAWNVEAVTKEFFKAYAAIFAEVEGLISGAPGDKRMFTQRLFNRLLFIRFLEKKEWLEFPAHDRKEEQTGYLHRLYNAAVRSGENFYRDRLYWLFFHGLGVLPNNISAHTDARLEEIRGEVPYLNGGLFEMEPGDEQDAVTIPNVAFELILKDLFLKFNFTITESMPDDEEVAIDPEMLGKVFEELVTGRHDSGSYYTPRPIVTFMCREALKGYLGGYEDLIYQHNVDGISVKEAKELLKKIAAIKIVDPACGSGAYLLGMLQELYQLTVLLDTRAEQATLREDYERKLQIIRNNLYGVDIDSFAVNIARLRLWLSLTVEASEPVPLPNLDFKISVGDSVLAADPTTAAAGSLFRHEAVERFAKLKADYANPYYTGDKSDLRKDILKLRREIASGFAGTDEQEAFDWRVEFAEVFDVDRGAGFDVVLANPPYVRQELLGKIKPTLQKHYPATYTGTCDLYVYFYTRAIQLLKTGGMLVFISSNKWFKANYGKKLRQYVTANCSVRSIIDFGELPVFETAATFPMIFIASKGVQHEQTLFTQVTSRDEPYPDIRQLIAQAGEPLPDTAFACENWSFANTKTADMLEKMRKAGIPLGDYVKGKIFYGIKTGYNKAFIIDGPTREKLIEQDARSAEIIKPLAVGDDIRKWNIRNKDRWLIVTKVGVDIKKYPAILEHLQQYQSHLEARWDKGAYWWELRPCAYYDAFDMPKIVYPNIMMERRFTYDISNYYTNQKCYIIATEDIFLLALLNSECIWNYLSHTCVSFGDTGNRGRLEPRRYDIANLTIPEAPAEDRAILADLAQKCLDAQGKECGEWESEIDERVAALYGL